MRILSSWKTLCVLLYLVSIMSLVVPACMVSYGIVDVGFMKKALAMALVAFIGGWACFRMEGSSQ